MESALKLFLARLSALFGSFLALHISSYELISSVELVSSVELMP